jgi:thiol-disulfide isomerase/thioredoxin
MSESGSVPRRSANLALIIMGVGLILIGLAAFYLLSKANQDSVSGESQQIYPVPAAVNYAAPELSLTDIKGVDSSLADYRGKVVLVNLWATWCPPCKKEMPTLQAFYNAHEADGFTIIAINDGDPTADVVQFVKDYQLTFSVWLDPKYVATEQAFQSMNLPSSYVIDRSGIIRLRWLGEISDEMLEKYVTPIIME